MSRQYGKKKEKVIFIRILTTTMPETKYTFETDEAKTDAFRRMAAVAIAALRHPGDDDELTTKFALEDFVDKLKANKPLVVSRRVLNSLMATLQSPVESMTDNEREDYRMFLVRLFNKPNPM